MSWQALEERTNRAALRFFGSTQSTPTKLGWKPVQGDLVEPSDEVFLDGVSAVASQPQFVMATPDVPEPVIDLILQVGPRAFRVADARPDGRGMTILMLEVAQ